MRDRSLAMLLALLSFWAFAWLSPQDPGNSQIITRLGLTLSIVEDGRLDIDKVAGWTIDKAQLGEHFYADKTPGHSLLAVPGVALTRWVLPVFGADADWLDRAVFARFAFAATLLTNGVLGALASAALFLAARRLGAGQAGAVFAAGSLALATPFLGWSTAFFAHSVSGSLLVIALCLLVWLGDARRPALVAGAAGLAMSYTAVVDLTTAPSLILLGLLALFLAWRAQRLAPVIAGLAVGGALGALPLVIYNQLAFGSPFRLGYSNVVGWAGMQQGLFGIGIPDPRVTAELLFGLYRGMLPLAPVLLLVPVGLWIMARKHRLRPVALLIGGVILVHLAINSGYYYWNGGWSTGPRHLVPALPLAALALAWAWPGRGAARVPVLALLGVSLVISLICAAGGMFAPEQFRFPVLEWVLPRALQGEAMMRAAPVFLSWLAFFWLLLRSSVEEGPRTGSTAGLPAVAD